ncbi:phenylalanyl-tRNA synthetase, alpha subunit family protein [Tritrichomonas foetus]|uniref:phenylalanine--tRNA ligase n=1 Tax=Tritrichomonas foetus TaxID=1144522 RepID=A0A1J4JAF8_9EUKA|nr:phenylalanyl-tRNA synthetase, alpha subunit family protein [Tritrichomonas foetus]|eukprot:OHS96136.1 phenylalanyl-tRNA synthetase, alpha subunit family protein [Tritrichomonas foetus]
MSKGNNLVENAVLEAVQNVEEVDSLELCKKLQEQLPELVHNHQDLHRVLLSLVALDLISLENKSKQEYELTAEGQLYAEEGTPEFKYGQIASENPGKSVKEMSALVAEQLAGRYTKPLPANPTQLANASFGKAKQMKYVNVKGPSIEAGDLSADKVKDLLNTFASDSSKVPAKEVNDLKKRGLVSLVTVKWFGIKKASSYVTNMSLLRRRVAELTEEMVKSGEWKDVDFAPLNFNALGSKISCGHEHPLLKVRYEFRQIFLQMGFEEMDTSKWVESSFWNFDSLFQGQQHPCRDMHDTFFLKTPEYGNPIADQEYFQRVKTTHEKGGQGSIGLRYEFDDKIPYTNILRTHTTAVSSRYLKMIADHYKATGEIRPRKFFSIDRVYRNETLDATHLAEFSQVEGFVIDKDLSLADLMSYIFEFFSRIGLNEIEFKPAYNPYTEPSMEIFAKHEGLGKWIEVGNSGMFRPEMLNPMGLPEGWNVVAWGFSLERPTMIDYKIDEIRKLEGPNVSLDLIENVPISRLTF